MNETNPKQAEGYMERNPCDMLPGSVGKRFAQGENIP
jgi:hypothetical protein